MKVERERGSVGTRSESGASGRGASVQLKEGLRGMSFEAQDAALRPVQRKGVVARAAGSVQAQAEQGTRGSGGPLPHLAAIQRSFGGHDVGGVRAHSGSDAKAASEAIGASAYAMGNDVAFGGAADLHTAAHEAAHVVQQRAGVSLAGGVGQAGDSYERHADQVADAVVQGKSAEPLLDRMGGSSRAISRGAGPVQMIGGKARENRQNGFAVRAGDTVEYTTNGKMGFLMRLTITHHNGTPLDKPVTLKESFAVEFLKNLDEADGLAVITESKTGEHKGETMQVLAREKNNTGDEDNPDTAGGTGNSYFSRPKVIAKGDDGTLTVQLELHTLNKWDRVAWRCRVGPKGCGLVSEDKSWWSNPGWSADELDRYKLKESFKSFPSEGRGEGGVRRVITATVPGAAIKRVYGEDLAGFDDASIICFGMEVFYGGGGPTTATKDEFLSAYSTSVATAHQYGYGATSSPEEYGYVDLSGAKLKEGAWLSEEEIWGQDIADNPSPNIRLPLPEDYPHQDLIKPLAPKGGMKMATRVENEATLKVSSLDNLGSVVSQLHGLTMQPGMVGEIMGGDETLDQFTWSVSEVKDNSMIFTDIYLDDLKQTALKAGIGIRKRSSDTATKLNVKTGEGYQVGDSDIYRRHEIGYDLDPKAKIEDIGTFLGAGVDEYDPWNRGGEQVNEALGSGEKVDFSQLKGQMVLQADRKKFNLKAVNKKSGGAINIEISCDHTVGRTFEAYESEALPEDLFKDMSGKYKQIFNVEMELEHLGAGAPTDTPLPKVESEPSHEAPKKESEPSESTLPKQVKRAPRNHPGRVYMRKDTSNPKFDTPSFEVFAKAQQRMVGALRSGLKNDQELKKDKQKLETLFGELFPG